MRRYALTGNYIKKLRNKTGLSQREVGKELDIHWQEFTNWEYGFSFVPKKRIKQLIKVIGGCPKVLIDLHIKDQARFIREKFKEIR